MQCSLQALSHCLRPKPELLHLSEDKSILGLSCDSRTVKTGDLFFAISGNKQNGESFIPEAIAKGCAAIVAEKPHPLAPQHVPQWIVHDIRQTLSDVARYFYDFPERQLDLYAVTGTNGKTTIAYLLQYLLADEQHAGYLGTLFYDTGYEKYPATTTTPDAIHLQNLLRQMVDHGINSATLELSSHALDQKRAFGMKIDAAIFTHLAEDHLEYHGGREAYFDAKSRLFDGRNGHVPKNSIINEDDAHGQRILQKLTNLSTRIYTYGCSSKAHVRAQNIKICDHRTVFDLLYQGEKWRVESPLLGTYNVKNILASMAALLATNKFCTDTLKKLKTFSGVPGRTQIITQCQGILTMVDYAHTADALARVLEMLKSLYPGRLLLVFGCGGCRDRGKRPKMMGIAQRWADEIWATSDNPRTEPQEQIFSDMKEGMLLKYPLVHWIIDRRTAIYQAIDAAQSGDILLVAGKGHESYQEIGSKYFPFDDGEVLRQGVYQRFSDMARTEGKPAGEEPLF
jgi:UDP-N-acetylmuramoyl-L-alanyl-D-glutamate--2,6-diaminopimelate ligase